MLQCMPVAPGAVKEPLPTQHRAIGQVQPEVLPKVAPGTLPATAKSSEDSEHSHSTRRDEKTNIQEDGELQVGGDAESQETVSGITETHSRAEGALTRGGQVLQESSFTLEN